MCIKRKTRLQRQSIIKPRRRDPEGIASEGACQYILRSGHSESPLFPFAEASSPYIPRLHTSNIRYERRGEKRARRNEIKQRERSAAEEIEKEKKRKNKNERMRRREMEDELLFKRLHSVTFET